MLIKNNPYFLLIIQRLIYKQKTPLRRSFLIQVSNLRKIYLLETLSLFIALNNATSARSIFTSVLLEIRFLER